MSFLGKVIAFHSYKGGTGKSFLSLNVAVNLALQGEKVALLDYDFRAPTLFHRFQPVNVESCSLNEYLDCRIPFEKVLFDYSHFLASKGTLMLGFASPKTRDMQEMQIKSRQWQQRALTLLMQAISKLKPQFDWIILDSSPGVTYDSLNAMSTSEAVVLVSTLDHADLQGSGEMCLEIWPSLMKFGAKPSLVLNKVPRVGLGSQDKLYDTTDLEKEFFEENGVEIILKIPIFCDHSLLTKSIFIREFSDHPLTKYVQDLGQILMNGR